MKLYLLQKFAVLVLKALESHPEAIETLVQLLLKHLNENAPVPQGKVQ